MPELKQKSLDILAEHSGNKNLIIKDELTTFSDERNPWKSFVFVGGPKFYLMFEAQFSTISLLGIAADRFSEIDEGEYFTNVRDFMREYCNLYVGKLKAKFEQFEKAYMSLPFISRDYCLETLFDQKTEDISSHAWFLGENNSFVRLKLHFMEKDKIEHLDQIMNDITSNDNESDIDFF